MLHTKFCDKSVHRFLRRRFLKGFYHTVQAAKRLYPSRSRSNKKRIKFLAKPTQNPRKFLAKFTLLPRLFLARQRELREISLLFHVQQKKNHAQEKKTLTFMKKNNLEVHVHVKY